MSSNASYMIIIIPIQWASLMIMIYIILIQILQYDNIYISVNYMYNH